MKMNARIVWESVGSAINRHFFSLSNLIIVTNIKMNKRIYTI